MTFSNNNNNFQTILIFHYIYKLNFKIKKEMSLSSKIKISESETTTIRSPAEYKVIKESVTKKYIPIPIPSKKKIIHKTYHMQEWDYDQEEEYLKYENSKHSIRFPNKRSQPRKSSQPHIINLQNSQRQHSNKISSFIIRNHSNSNYNKQNNIITSFSKRANLKSSRSPTYNRSIIYTNKSPPQASNPIVMKTPYRKNGYIQLMKSSIPFQESQFENNQKNNNTRFPCEESNIYPYDQETYNIYGDNSIFCTPLRETPVNKNTHQYEEREINPYIHYHDYDFNEIKPNNLIEKTPDEIYIEKIIIIQSNYRGHLTRKYITYHLNMFFKLQSLIDVLDHIYNKRKERFVWYKLKQYYHHKKNYYLKNYYGIQITKIPTIYKKHIHIRFRQAPILKKELCETFEYVNETPSVQKLENYIKLYQLRLKNRILNQLLKIKANKDEQRLRNNWKKFHVNGIEMERIKEENKLKEQLNQIKNSKVKLMLKEQVQRSENKLKKGFQKFYYAGVMKQMTMTPEQRNYENAMRKLKKIVLHKDEKLKQILKNALMKFYYGGILRQVAIGNNPVVEQLRRSFKEEIIHTQPEIVQDEEKDKIKKRKVRLLINKKLEAYKNELHQRFMKFYFRGLYRQMTNPSPNPSSINDKQQEPIITSSIPQQNQNINEFPIITNDNVNINDNNLNSNNNIITEQETPQEPINEESKSRKQKARELRKLINKKNKNNNSKLKYYFQKFYTKGIISQFVKAPKRFIKQSNYADNNSNSDINSDQREIYSTSQIELSRAMQAKLEEEEKKRLEEEKQEQERQAQIIAKLNKIFYRVERNNLLVEKNVFGRWNLRSKLLRLQESAPPKKKKKKGVKKKTKEKNEEVDVSIQNEDIQNSDNKKKKVLKSKKKKINKGDEEEHEHEKNISSFTNTSEINDNNDKDNVDNKDENIEESNKDNNNTIHEEEQENEDERAQMKFLIRMMLGNKSKSSEI